MDPGDCKQYNHVRERGPDYRVQQAEVPPKSR